MAKKSKAYFGLGLPWILNVILGFFLGWILACGERLYRGKLLMAILALPFLLGFVFWIVDLVSWFVNKDVKWLA